MILQNLTREGKFDKVGLKADERFRKIAEILNSIIKENEDLEFSEFCFFVQNNRVIDFRPAIRPRIRITYDTK